MGFTMPGAVVDYLDALLDCLVGSDRKCDN